MIRYAKPKPKVPVNEQGVPVRQKPLPAPKSKKPPKYPQSVQDSLQPSPAPEPMSSVPDDEPLSNEPYAGVYQPVPSEPQRPFADLQEETFPVDELGYSGGGIIKGSFTGDGDFGPRQLAEYASEAYSPGYDHRANRALGIISAAGQMHDSEGNGSKRIHTQQVGQTDIPVGHARVMPLIPTAPNIAHVVKIHYPQGQVTTYRARLNDDDTGYR